MRLADVDKTYIISLPKSDRLESTIDDLWLCNIRPEIWNATRMNNGADGLKATFKSIFQNALKKGWNNVLVFEDDVIGAVKRNEIYAHVDCAISELPPDFHMLKFGANLLTPVEKVSRSLNRTSRSYALHACLYSKKAMMLILSLVDLDNPLDVSIMQFIEPLGKCYVTNQMIFTQRPSKSEIFKYDPNIHKNVSSFYNVETGIIDWDVLMQQSWKRNTQHIK